MQIKKEATSKTPPNTDLVRRWLDFSLPPIAGIIFLPYLFLFLGWLYTDEFHSIPTQTLLGIVVVQGLFIILIPVITAWITLKHVSQQLRTLSQGISLSAEKVSQSSFTNDGWVSLEKQPDDIGRTAKQIKAIFLAKSTPNNPDLERLDSYEEPRTGPQSAYSSLFTLKMQEKNSRIY